MKTLHTFKAGTIRPASPKSLLFLCVGGAVAATLGCSGEDWQAETYPATGRVTVNGNPPVGAVVELRATASQPDERNSRPWGIVQQDGTYTLTTYATGDGAPPGEYAFTMKWPPDVSKPSLADRLNGAFADPKRSRWTMTVSERDNELPSVEITGVKVQSEERAKSPRRAPPGPGMGG